jgi:LysM repeat protein/lipoprotein-anchoring transpeptidase ErfK/SrfK
MRIALLITASAISPVLEAQVRQLVPPKAIAVAPAVVRIEPGLETAVHWQWRVVPSDEKEWGLHLPDPEAPKTDQPGVPGAPSTDPTAPRPTTYTVVKGDALILIGKKFGITAFQLKAFNGLETDTIRIGQELKIPTMEEARLILPPPPPEPPPPTEKQKKKAEAAAAAAAKPPPELPHQEDLLLQIFLDRVQFSTGPIDGNPGEMFNMMSQRYRETHEDAANVDAFRQKARTEVGSPTIHYTLKAEDFRFIETPASEGTKGHEGGKKSSHAKTSHPEDMPTYEELVAAPALVYRDAWEFIAERFHCDEPFLRSLNPRVKAQPVTGTEFQVPNVIPFEVEKALEGTLQPAADPAKEVSATLVGLTRIEIMQDGKLVAAMPIALARPDLRGRGTWTVLDAIPRPRLATLQEEKEDSKKSSAPDANGTPPPAPKPALTTEQYLQAGPNNPVGVVWMNLAKAKSTEPLPYGLHGTSIPNRMKTQEGIGGIRLANWDIARVVRLLPPGTPLHWK